MKPSTKRTGAGTRDKPQPAPAPATDTAPAAAVKDAGGDAMFDDAPPPPVVSVPPVDPAAPSEPPVATDVAPVSAPAEGAAQEPQAPEAPVAQPQPEPTPPPPPPSVDDTAKDPVVEEAKDAIAPPPAAPERIRLGRVEGALHCVPLVTVQALLGDAESRIDALRTSPAIAALQPRVRATDGRCAPIIFTIENVAGAAPCLFSGLEGYVAALNLGLDPVPVIIIDAGDAGAAQAHLVSRAHGRSADPLESPFEVIE